MLPQYEKLTEKKRLTDLPLLERPKNVRLKFRKVGKLQYISHLDLQRTFMRVIVRACIPAWYTKGFNPHAKLVFSSPLSVGAESEYEFLDIRIDRYMHPEDIMNRLNGELTEELCITEAYFPKTEFSEIAWSDYEIRIHTANGVTETVEKIKAALTSPMLVTKKTKAGEKEIDVIPLIHSFEIAEEDGNIRLFATLKATVGEFLNPELLITGLRNKTGILSGDPTEEWYSIKRVALKKDDMSLFK